MELVEDSQCRNRTSRLRFLRSISKRRSGRSPGSTPSTTPTPPGISASSTAITSLLGRPVFVAALTIVAVGWVSLNSLAVVLGYRALDSPPFPWLAGAASLASLYLVVLILTTQRRDDRLAQRSELLNLKLAILSEQKTAKVVALLEELRRDSPAVCDRVDKLADVIARPAEPQSVIDAIKETRSEAAHASRAADGA